MSIKRPPIETNSDGELRKVGYELEFAGPELIKVAELIRDLYGGEVQEVNRYEYRVTGTDTGTFRVELDARILQKVADQGLYERLGLDFEELKLRESFEDVIDRLARKVVPLEVVMPPVPVNRIGELEQLRAKLQDHKAEGTKASWVHAFGMHINIETPALTVETLLRYLRAFMLIYPWLLERLKVDISRRISPFVDPFPAAYTRKILNPGYEPGRGQLVDDYLMHNATRNRPLDMLPLFATMDREGVESAMGKEKNNPRPTFHYRLPNSRIDDPHWQFSDEWNRWCAVEELASDPEMISKLSRLYLLKQGSTLMSFKKEWAETVKILMELDE